MKQLFCKCPHCKADQIIPVDATTMTIDCPGCGKSMGEIKNKEDIFDYCPICDCRQFYLTKDFNQYLGYGIVVLACILVPVTYGLSLPVLALIDWLLYKRAKNVVNCYRCGCEFHNIDYSHKNFKPFMHHIGLKYDKYR